jgi:NitT/TauT family transport system substrate-binding protein
MRFGVRIVGMALSCLVLAACHGRGDPNVVRAGHFPNVTHAHGLLAHHRTMKGSGGYESHLPAGMRIEWSVFNAGPAAMERMIGGSLDVTYVGPSPALNAYFRSEGQSLRVLAGATRGGSALVVQGDDRIREAKDFRGKTVATPQFGNTQDVACRAWLRAQGFEVRSDGGDVIVDPRANPETLVLFKQGLLEAHAELTAWMGENPDEARDEVRAALQEVVQVVLKPELAQRAWKRMRFDDAIAVDDFRAFVDASRDLGFLEDEVPLDRLLGRP